MRKLLLLCAMLLSGIGAWAEDVFVMPETGKYYILKGDNTSKPWLTNQLTGNSIVVSEDETAAAVFLKTQNGLQDVATGKYLGMNDKVVSLVANETTVTIGQYNDGNTTGNGTKYSVKVGTDYMYNNNTDGKTHESSDWITTIERYWGFIEVPTIVNKGVIKDGVYTIENKINNRGTICWGKKDNNEYFGLTEITLGNYNTNNVAPETNAHKYWYITTRFGVTYIYNLGKGQFLQKYSQEVASCGETANEPDFTFEQKGAYICIKSGNNYLSTSCGWAPNDGSVRWLRYEKEAAALTLTEVENGLTTYENIINNINFPFPSYTITDVAGNVYKGDYEGTVNETEPTFTGVSYTLINKAWNGREFTADITFPVPVSSETVSNPTFISTYNYNKQAPDQFKWYASDNKIKVKEGEEIFSSSIASHLWLIYPKFNNGAFTFQIKNVATGLFINSSVSSNKHDDESTVILSNEATDFTVGKRASEGAEFINSFEKRLSVNTSDPNPADKIQTVGTYDTHYGTALTFPVPGFNVTIGATGYATLYSPITVLPEAGNQTLEIYQIVSAPKNNSVRLYQMPYVYKNQGVILKGNSETKYWFALTDWDSFIEEDWKFNKLKGSYVDTYVAGPAYVLANGDNGVGLYKAMLNFTVAENGTGTKVEEGATGTHFKNNAGKAYLPASAAASDARFLVFNFGDDVETGITEMENGNVKTEVYDLSGRRVQGAQKGIFIVNGKKVVR